MKTQSERRKLKNYLFVNKAQMTIFISNLIVLLIILGIFILAVLVPFYWDMFKTEDIHQQNLISRNFIVLLERCSFMFFVALIPLFIQQTLVIHRICGPFVPFKRMLDNFSTGDISSRIHLRRYDFFQAEASQVNGIMDRLASLFSNISDHQHLIMEELKNLSSSGEESEKLMQALKNIEKQARKSIDELSKIKVVSL